MSLATAYREALASYSYTPEEAHFLYLVVTHSGYFCARQFRAFSHADAGKRSTQFWAKLRTQKHVRTESFPTNGIVYRVVGRELYRQLGRENPRNRREHEIEYVERQIALFDFILAHLEFDYLETEHEKRAYFVETCSVDAS